MLKLSAQKEQFILYGYLKYFWEKKWILVIVPILSMVIAIGVKFTFFNPIPYIGNATIYTGSVNSEVLTNPNNIIGKYDDKVEGQLNITVPTSKYLRINIQGENEQLVNEDLENVKEQILNELLKNYEERLNITSENLEALEEKRISLEETITNYSIKYEEGNSSDFQLSNPIDILLWSESEHSKIVSKIQNMKNDLVFFEEPDVTSYSVKETNKYIVETLFIGFILGIILAITLLIFLKYIFDARRFYN